MAQTLIDFSAGQITDGTAGGGTGDNVLSAGGLVFTIAAAGNWTANFSGGRFNFSEDPAAAGSDQFTITVTMPGYVFDLYDYQIHVDFANPILGTNGFAAEVEMGQLGGWADYTLSSGVTTGSFFIASFGGVRPLPVTRATTFVIKDRFIGFDPAQGTGGPATFWLDNLTVDSNQSPIISNFGSGDNQAYVIGGGPILVDLSPTATITDPDNSGWNTGRIRLQITAGRVTGEDALGLRNEGTGAGQVGVSGSNVTYGGVLVGTLSGGGTSSSSVSVTLNASATDAAVAAIMHNFTYNNLGASPTGTRSLTMTATDSLGGISSGYVETITFAAPNTPPTATIVVADASLIAGESSLVTITFSEAVNNFDNNDLTIANGSLSNVTSSDGGITWTATFTPNANVTDTTNIITLNNAGVNDLLGLAGSGTTDSNNYAIDTARPTATIVVADTSLIVGETSLVTITFSEAVTGLQLEDFSVGVGALTGLSTSDGGITWTATFTPAANVTNASNYITLDNTGISDSAGNSGTGTTDSNSYDVDGLRPTANIVVSDTDLTIGETTTVTITFSEAVTNFDNTDLTIENGTLTDMTSTDGGVTWTATFTPTAGINDATNLITLNKTTITDIAGNAGTGTTDSNTYAIDTVNDAAVAVDDAFNVTETGVITAGNLFAANPSTADSDDELDSFAVTHINGVALVSGAQITLASGAILTVNDNGTFSYDPNGMYQRLGASGSGAVAGDLAATDSFTYTITGGSTATATITISGEDNNDVLHAQYDEFTAVPLLGGAGNDTLYAASGGQNQLDGGAGNDILFAGIGTDSLLGGANTDWVSYELSGGAVVVDLATPANSTGDAAGDSYSGIEGFILSDNNDTFEGAALDDIVYGQDGNDTLNGNDGNDRLTGGAGADAHNGGAGNDTAFFNSQTTGVTLDLSTPSNSTNDAAGDSFSSIESYILTNFGDTAIGSGIGETIKGRDGADDITGGGGGDRLFGGVDADTFIYVSLSDSARGAERDIIADFEHGIDKIDLSALGLTHEVTNFTGVAGEVRIVVLANQVALYGDSDGDRQIDFHIQFNKPVTLDAGDILFSPLVG